MTYDKSQSIQGFLEAAAAKQPTPGGGSVAALAGALAAAMGEMVINYSIGKKDLAAYQDRLNEALHELQRARQVLLELMVEDQAAFAALTEARKRPESDPTRGQMLEEAMAVCVRIPQLVGVTATAILRTSNRLCDQVNKYLLSDLAVCAELAMATVRCAAYNVRANLVDFSDAERSAIQYESQQQTADGTNIIKQLIPRIWARAEQP